MKIVKIVERFLQYKKLSLKILKAVPLSFAAPRSMQAIDARAWAGRECLPNSSELKLKTLASEGIRKMEMVD